MREWWIWFKGGHQKDDARASKLNSWAVLSECAGAHARGAGQEAARSGERDRSDTQIREGYFCLAFHSRTASSSAVPAMGRPMK
jgi:hypothetical protein